MDEAGNHVLCVICKSDVEDSGVTLSQKGTNGINQASKARGDTLYVVPGECVHKECRQRYTHPTNIARSLRQSQEQNHTQMTLRSHEKLSFNFKNNCLFCGSEIDKDLERRRGRDVFTVCTTEMQNTLLSDCNTRKDEWAELVRARIQSVHDLPAASAVYHHLCSTNFRKQMSMPGQFNTNQPKSKKRKSGRPVDSILNDAFLKVAKYIEDNDDVQVTISDLTEKMNEFLKESAIENAYSSRHMKERIKDHFGDNVIITSTPGKANIVTFRQTAASILDELHKQQKENLQPEDEKLNIIRAAAKLIHSDLRLVENSDAFYPLINTNIEKQVEYLPPTLRLLLNGIFSGKNTSLKVASIGQAVMQSSRPRSILAPLQIGLAIQLHHSFSSRFLIDTLHHLGFCSSYHEVLLFKQNATADQGTNIPEYNGQFVQYVADNVDHNLRTIDGHNTFHGMGLIATVTPGTSMMKQVPRKIRSVQEISSAGTIKIQAPSQPRMPSLEIKFNQVSLAKIEDPTATLDVLWKTSLLFDEVTRPSWAGIMQTVHQGISHNGQSSICFLPMIDMSPSDLTCINSTLHFVYNHAHHHGIANPMITFDQPLWYKAFCLIHTETPDSPIRNVIPRLGGFHTLMNFLGSIGHLMAGSGLKELLELIYAPNAVEHMLSGKAVSRALRGHLIIDAALNTLLYSSALGKQIPLLQEAPSVTEEADVPDESLHGGTTEDEMEEDDVNRPEADGVTAQAASFNEGKQQTKQNGTTELVSESQTLYQDLVGRKITLQEVAGSEVLQLILKNVSEESERCKDRSRTARLWLQYVDMVGIVRAFIKAERTGNWEMHLQVLSQMLPYFAASGHNLYTESATLYLQSMKCLSNEHPDVYKSLDEGFHVVRRSDRFWAGLSTDLVIEQVLMRSLKTTGGLTRGSGMTEQQRTTWLLSSPACAKTNYAMQDLVGIQSEHGDQHKDLSDARLKRDLDDTKIILTALSNEGRNPFVQDKVLKNIMTGVNAEEQVDVDDAKVKGEHILMSMAGQLVRSFSFKRKNQSITLAAGSSVKIDGIKVQVDPQLLFQRLVFACKTMPDLQDVFKYELCTFPAALFDSPLTLRQPQKSTLCDALWDKLTIQARSGPTGKVRYILDGGALLYRVPWPKKATYEQLYRNYCHYVQQKYGERTVVVFDGYEHKTTKMMTQQRRSAGKVGVTVSFEDNMKVTFNRDVFLANTENKKRFITQLGHHLQLNGYNILQADGDADLLIVETAISAAASTPTVLVGDDTDLLVLLCYHVREDGFDIFFSPEPKSNSTHIRVWNMNKVKAELSDDLCTNILFIHAISGCDTTSRPFGIGKSAPLKKFRDSNYFRNQAKVFHKSEVNQQDVIEAGENALVALYGGRPGDTLDSLRHRKYYEKVCTRGRQVEPQNLPPTSNAASFHSLRVFLQIKQWQGNDENFQMEEWGWRLHSNSVLPISMTLPAAPDNLLKIIRCNCTTGCSTARCTCYRHGLECSMACGHCKGTVCSNRSIEDSQEEV